MRIFEHQSKIMQEAIKAIILDSVSVKQALSEDAALLERVEKASSRIIQAFQNGHKVFFCGNGGSAADAQHLAAEFSGRFYTDRDPLPSEALHCNTSYLTAVANDYGYEQVYSRLIKGLARKGDILIGLSTSGNSANICKAFEMAGELGIQTVGMTGAAGGRMKDLSDILLNVPSSDTPRIQESHILLGHIICQLTEAALFKNT